MIRDRCVKACGKLPSPLATGSDLLGEQADVVGVGLHLLEGIARRTNPPGAGKSVHIEEGAETECAFGAPQTVRGGRRVVAVDEAVRYQGALHRVQGRQPADRLGRQEPDARNEQQRSVEDVAAVVLDEGLLRLVPAPLHHLFEDRVASRGPTRSVGGTAVLSCQAQPPVEGHPRHHSAEGEVLAPTTGLPDAYVGAIPGIGEPVQRPREVLPAVVAASHGDLTPLRQGIERLAVDVQLQLTGCCVPGPHRVRTPIALEVGENLFRQLGVPVDAVHDLQRLAFDALPVLEAVAQPARELRRLLGEPQVEQGTHGQGAVTDPGVAVVPVAFTPDLFGQAHGGGGDGSTCGCVGEQLERDGRAVHHPRPPAAIPGGAHPALPEFHHVPEPLHRRVRGDRRRRVTVGSADGEHRCGHLARPQGHRTPHVPAVLLQGEGALQKGGDVRCMERGGTVLQVEMVGGPAVVEARTALQSEAHRSAHCPHSAYQHVPVRRGAGAIRWHAVEYLADPVRRHESRNQDCGVGVVELLAGGGPAIRREQEVAAAVVVEQGGEDTGRVEPGSREPVDDPLGRHQSSGL